VDIALSEDEIRQGVKFLDDNLEIRNITRLKYRDRTTMELRDSQSVKFEFASNLLPEFLSIWNVRSRVRPYINRVRKCFNCFRWGHSAIFCRSKETCSRCGEEHNSEVCNSDAHCCINCKGAHHPFDMDCPIFNKYKIINATMAYCNINQFKAKKLIKARNITTMDQVERTFKSSAYFAWSLLGVDSEADSVRGSSIASLRRDLQDRRRSRINSKRNDHHSGKNGSSLVLEENVADQTLVPESPMDQDNYLVGENPTFTVNQLALVPGTDEAEPSASAPFEWNEGVVSGP